MTHPLAHVAPPSDVALRGSPGVTGPGGSYRGLVSTEEAPEATMQVRGNRVSDLTVFVVMVNDRHSDPEPFVFTTEEDAVDFARARAREYAYDQSDIDESPADGWLYRATYSVEGDSVWVISKGIDENLPGAA